MAVSHPTLCRNTALRHTVALAVFSAMAPLLDVTNIWFALETLPLNAYFIYLGTVSHILFNFITKLIIEFIWNIYSF